MSEIWSDQTEESGSSVPCVVSKDKDDCVKPSENNTADENLSVRAIKTEPESTNENSLEGNKNVNSANSTSSNLTPIKVKRRSGGRPKHRAGRNRKRRWRPYSKLSWNERQKVDERDARRAQRVRDEMAACGLLLAPYNTTQFLMNDHNIEEPDYEHIQNGIRSKASNRHDQGDSSDYSFPGDDDYINQQFMEDYETYHDQYLNSLTQEELIEQCLELEDKIEALEKKRAGLRQERKVLGLGTLDPDAEMEKIQVFREEIRKIKIENAELEKLNTELERSLSSNS